MFHYIHTFIMFKHTDLENNLNAYVKNLKKHAHFKISSRDEVLTRLFYFFSSWDEISSLSFILG